MVVPVYKSLGGSLDYETSWSHIFPCLVSLNSICAQCNVLVAFDFSLESRQCIYARGVRI